ncbi:MAG: hypothetical protein HOV86_37065 [Thermoactinospora sp.]|nr:hypothetical protein [Thermoactinospora sp.]
MRVPRIAIITHERDLHAFAVQHRLRERFGVGAHIVETDHFYRSPGLSWTPEGVGVLPGREGEAVEMAEMDLIWFRRVGNGRTTALPEVTDPDYRDVIFSDSATAAIGMVMAGYRGNVVDHPQAVHLAQSKVLQLRIAHDVGWRLPQTLISQSPERIRAFCEAMGGAAIVKVVGGSSARTAATTVVSKELLADEASLSLAPAIYQELIPGSRHLRVQVFGDRVHAALFEVDELDWRFDLNFPAREYPLPDEVAKNLHEVLRRLDLKMGIFDLKLTDAGEYVWLEINPQGQWLFVEGMTGMPLLESFSTFLYGEATARW